MEELRTKIEKPASLSVEIRKARESLEEKNAVSVDMRLSEPECRALANIIIDKDLNQFNSYGSGEALVSDIKSYLSELDANSEEDTAQIAWTITRLTTAMKHGFGAEAAWTMIRVSQKSASWDMPRWHQDGSYIVSDGAKQYKLVASLRGPQTLFGEAVDTEQFKTLEYEAAANYDRNKFDDDAFHLEDMRIRQEMQKIVQPKTVLSAGEATLYLVGDPDAAIHSEPPLTQSRIFIAILAGSSEQIDAFAKRYSKAF